MRSDPSTLTAPDQTVHLTEPALRRGVMVRLPGRPPAGEFGVRWPQALQRFRPWYLRSDDTCHCTNPRPLDSYLCCSPLSLPTLANPTILWRDSTSTPG